MKTWAERDALITEIDERKAALAEVEAEVTVRRRGVAEAERRLREFDFKPNATMLQALFTPTEIADVGGPALLQPGQRVQVLVGGSVVDSTGRQFLVHRSFYRLDSEPS